VNYTEGQVFADGQGLRASQTSQLEPGQLLQTNNGRVEILLTPGVFLRLDYNSQARLDANSITDTRVTLLKGQAMVEAAQVEKENGIQILEGPFAARIDKRGIYEFNADQARVAVYDGEATVRSGDQTVNVKKGHELTAGADKLKAQSFNTKNTDMLYAWSELRSKYMAEANMAEAKTIVINNPGWFYGTGWYWNPYFSSWAFVPGYGYFNSPFGFGFYSPAYWVSYRPWFGYRGFVTPGAPAVRSVPAAPAYRGSSPAMRVAPAGGAQSSGGGAAHFGGRR
jgi:hypothetical protein